MTKKKKIIIVIASVLAVAAVVAAALLYYHLVLIHKQIKIQYSNAKQTSTEKMSQKKVGDTIIFGSYEQDNKNSNGKESIEWIVLSNNGSELFVVSRYALDCICYNQEDVESYIDFHYTPKKYDWENSQIRQWLNTDFYNEAFNTSQKNMIKNTYLRNDNAEYGIEGGNDTVDKVFLLSLEDVTNTSYGFSSECAESDIDRRCAPTAYAVSQGAYANRKGYKTFDDEFTCWWWLRTLRGEIHSVYVGGSGDISPYGGRQGSPHGGIRPAIVIDLNP